MKHKTISLILAMAIVLSLVPAAFADSGSVSEAATTLNTLGLFNGTGADASGNPIYDLDRSPTRQEAVTMLVRILGKEAAAKSGTWVTPFSDVENWAKPYVGYAYTNGLVSGTGTATFDGSAKVTASQYITLVLRALGYSSDADFKWDSAWTLSDKLGITDGTYNAGSTAFLRGDVAVISKNALSAKLKSGDKQLIQILVADGAVDGKTAISAGFDVYGWLGNIEYVYDVRTFTLFAFMNYTGYDDNNGHEITGVRKMLRDDLDSMDITISSPNYFTNKNIGSSYYANTLNYLGAAPDFKFISTNYQSGNLLELPSKLSEFYSAANIANLYEKYRPYYEKELEKYRSAASGELLEMISYFRLKDVVFEDFGIEVNLLDARERGSGLGTVDLFQGHGVIRTGPSDMGANVLNIVHEYCHGITNPLVTAQASAVSALSKYYVSGTVAYSQGYKTWDSIVNEAFVRAISCYFVPAYGGRTLAQQDESQGFTMTLYIYDRIPEFAKFNGTFEQFVNMLLAEYPNYADKY